MSDVLVRADGVSKKFCRNLKRSLWYGLKDIGSDLVGRSSRQEKLRPGEFWAVDDVTFELSRGECLGLVGRNGAGKTSLLRMLNGLIRPDKGRIEMHGSVGALIALGAGIKPVLSGRENIYCMAALRGMSRAEATCRIDEIISFAELEDSIDSPMQSYSSGMRVRLSFAVASALDPDILLLDEVLAVGDAAFRDKCYHRIAEVRRNAAVIFVSHNMEQVARVSSSALVLHKGAMLHAGDVDEAIAKYGEVNSSSLAQRDAFVSVHPPIVAFRARLVRNELSSGEPLEIEMEIDCSESLEQFQVKIMLYNSRGEFAADGIVAAPASLTAGRNRLRARVESVPLKNGIYRVAINVIDGVGDLVAWSYKQHSIAIRQAYVGAMADCQLRVALDPRFD